MRLGRATLASIAIDAAITIAGVAATPWLVASLGNEQYGTLALVSVLASQLAFLQLGTPAATVRCLAERQSSGDDERISIERSAWLLGLLSAFLAAAGALLLSAWGSNRLVARGQLDSPQQGLIAATTCVLGAQPLMATAAAVLVGSGRFDAGNKLRLLHGVPRVLAPALLARGGLNVVGVVLVQGLIDLVASVYVWRSRLGAAQRVNCGGVTRQSLARLLGIGLPFTLAVLVAAPLTDLEKVGLAAMRSVDTLPYYTVPYGVVTRLMAIPGALGGFLVVRLTAAFAVGDRARAAELLDLGSRVSSTAVSIISLGLMALTSELLSLWLGPAFATHSTLPARILLVGVVANAAAYAAQAAIRGFAPPYTLAGLYLVQLPFYAGAVVFFVGHWGAVGAAVAWSLRTVFDSALQHLLARRQLGLRTYAGCAMLMLPSVSCFAFAWWAHTIGDELPAAWRLLTAIACQMLTLAVTVRPGEWAILASSLRR